MIWHPPISVAYVVGQLKAKSLAKAMVFAALRLVKPCPLYLAGLMTLAAPLCGCTTLKEYVHNGFKVGPNYGRPPAPVAPNWIDAADPRVRTESDDLNNWWTVFNDRVLDDLICSAYLLNLT